MKRITKKEENLQLLKSEAYELYFCLGRDYPDLPPETLKLATLKALIALFLGQKRAFSPSYLEETLETLNGSHPDLFLQLQNIKDFDSPQVEAILPRIHELIKGSEFDLLDFSYIYECLNGPEDGVFFTQEDFIEKAIAPLFMERLEKAYKTARSPEELRSLNEEIVNLKLLDPACGAGNFLIYSFYRLNALNEKILKEYNGQKLSLKNFTGYEIKPQLAQAARLLLSALCQPSAKIVTADAVSKSWQDDLPQGSYIIGNPPYLGARKMSAEQKSQLKSVFKNTPNSGNLDYSSCWLKKASENMDEGQRAVYVCTDSLFQGQSVHDLWQPLLEDGVEIDFAYPSLKWENRQKNTGVSVSIVSFSKSEIKPKLLFKHEEKIKVDHINAYLTGRPDIFIEPRKRPTLDVPKLGIGNKPVDGGHLLFTKEEMQDFIKKEPQSRKFFRPFYGSREFLNGSPRYCLWLGDSKKEEYDGLVEVNKRLKAVTNYRKNSKSEGTVRIAGIPQHFHVENFPPTDYFVIPRVISPDRDYLPVGPLPKEAIASDSMHVLTEPDYAFFALLSSRIHMIWTKAVCGRYGSALRYSAKIVYNNFPWPESREGLIESAKNILAARDASIPLRVQYDPKKMPQALRRAHQENDERVAQIYGITDTSSEKVLDHLFKLYQSQERKS